MCVGGVSECVLVVCLNVCVLFVLMSKTQIYLLMMCVYLCVCLKHRSTY